MNGRAYYNENDPAAVAVLRELIARNVILPGDVDDRSIKDVQPRDLAGYTQCHFVSPLDGKARRAKPGIPFLVDGLPGRVDLWRVGGNAIVPVLAAEVIASFLETEAIGATP